MTFAGGSAGTLDLEEINGLTVSVSDNFVGVIEYDGISGTFATINPSFGDLFTPTYGLGPFPDTLDLLATSISNFFNWIGGNGDWGTAANWLDPFAGNTVPGSGDDAQITPLVTVTVTGAETASHLQTSSDATISISNSLTLEDSSTLNGTLTLSSGTLLINNGATLTSCGRPW